MTALKLRQVWAASLAFTFGIVVPIIVLLGTVIVFSWTYAAQGLGVIHLDDIHATFWGWLTTWSREDGHRVASPNNLVPFWIWGWVNAWLVYELCEALAALIRGFARLARKGA